eukprot:6190457-Pleurochrysis_carterae.AAC.1
MVPRCRRCRYRRRLDCAGIRTSQAVESGPVPGAQQILLPVAEQPVALVAVSHKNLPGDWPSVARVSGAVTVCVLRLGSTILPAMAEAAAMSHAMPIGHVPYAGIMAEASAIKQRLGQTGILAAVRAQLREAVLQAMTSGKLDDATEMFGFDDPHNDENINPSLGSALGAADLLAVALVDDFLHVHGCTRSQEALRDELVGYHARPSRAETVQQLWPGQKPPVHTDAEPLLLRLLPAHVRSATNDQDVMHSDRLLSALPGACHSREGAHGAASKDFLAAERAAATSQNTFNTAASAAPAASPTAAVAAAPIAAPAAGIARASLFAAAPTTAAPTVTAPATTTKSNPAPSNNHDGAFREETKDDPTTGDVKNTCAPAASARFSQLPTPSAAAASVASQSSSASPSLLGALPP